MGGSPPSGMGLELDELEVTSSPRCSVINKIEVFVQVGFSIGAKPKVFHCSFRDTYNNQ